MGIVDLQFYLPYFEVEGFITLDKYLLILTLSITFFIMSNKKRMINKFVTWEDSAQFSNIPVWLVKGKVIFLRNKSRDFSWKN